MTKNIGGIEMFQKNIVDCIDREKFEIEFASASPDAALIPYLEEKGIKTHIIPPHKKIFAYCRAMYRLIKSEKYDIVHIHKNSCIDPFDFIICRLAGVKKIVAHSHSTAPINLKKLSFIHYIFRPLIRNISTDMAACSPDAARWLFGKKAYESGKVTVISNGIDTRRFRFDPEVRLRVRKEYGLDGELVFGHVGNFVTAKNHFFLVEIFDEIVKIHPRSTLMLVGSGELAEKVRKYAKKLGIEEKIMFMGTRHDVNELMQGMDMFLLPSLYEGFPISGVEAQTAGLPCLFSDAITRDILLTPKARQMPLSSSAEKWAGTAVSAAKEPSRADNSQMIIDAGYGIYTAAAEIDKIYSGKTTEEKGNEINERQPDFT